MKWLKSLDELDIITMCFVIIMALLLTFVSMAGSRMEPEDTSVTTVATTTQTAAPQTIATTTSTMEPVTAPITTTPTTTTISTTKPKTTTTIVTTTEPEPEPIDIIARELLACVIYQEAGADYVCDDCRRRVADVVLNRVMSKWFPGTIYEVLTQKSQYGRYHWTGVVWPSSSSQESEKNAVERAYRIAEEVLRGDHSELYGKGWIWQAEFPQGKEQVKCCGIYFGR